MTSFVCKLCNDSFIHSQDARTHNFKRHQGRAIIVQVEDKQLGLYTHNNSEGEKTMVNTDQAIESDYITPELVKNSPTKTCVPLSEGDYEKTDYGDRLTLPVQIDGKEKKFRPSKDTVMNLRNAYGHDSKTWVGKPVQLQVIRYKGKDAILGNAPTQQPSVQANMPAQVPQGVSQ